ncbi:MAG: hypothetical protein Q8927_11295 [Bacteroidota bacterium]|nr:hypothetical protein [Bacteroidota bacterium]MDP4216777.1 hypothetical protein [Bacteroidota bacterium]MDP4246979.1 hypothetical protein [Bacteroidota bacterium]MDP4252643.1 hypothetical protein [Bacteroidota bacterium]MDP4258508.1 hypothetical protein [Bacteroidota bacterium]
MKKLLSTSAVLMISLGAFAQEDKEPLVNRQLIFDILNITAVVGIIYLLSNWILQIMKTNLDYRLKNKIIEKETAENIVSQLVQPARRDEGNGRTILQWFFILAGIGVGFTLVDFTQPFGLHSLAIMAFSIAAGFAGFYYASRRLPK